MRDVVLTVVGLVALTGVLTLLGRRKALRNLTEEHFYVAGIVILGLALLAFGLYNRYIRG